MVKLTRQTFLAFLLLTALLPLLAGIGPAAGEPSQSYNVTVTAFFGDDHEISGVPIFIDGIDTGYGIPHTFTLLTGFHNFSLSNEDGTGHFMDGPPALANMPSNAEFMALSRGMNWIIIGPPAEPNSEATLRFTYGSTPVVEISRDTFVPGAVAIFGVRVHMDPTRTVSGVLDLYDHDWVADTSRSIPSYSKSFTIHGTQATAVQYKVPRDAHTGIWSYRATIEDSSLHVEVNGTFDVSFPSAPTPETYLAAQTIPFTTFDVAGTRYALFGSTQASIVVLYVGGGTIGNTAGPTPINGYSDLTNENSGTYRLVSDLVAHGFSVVTPGGHWQGLDFPSQVVDYLHKEGMKTTYGIGYSAGGVVIASNLISHPNLFGKAVIIDSPLTEDATGFYFTGLSIQAGVVRVPNLLVWGREDTQVRLSNAYAWIDRVGSHYAALAIYDYGHDWTGISAEAQVRGRIVSFLSASNSQPKESIAPGSISHYSSLGSSYDSLDNKLSTRTLEYYSMTFILTTLTLFAPMGSRLFLGLKRNSEK